VALYKNKASQKFPVTAWDTDNNVAKTGDASNITALLFNDGVAVGTATDDTNPTEMGTSGVYVFNMTQAESNFDMLILAAESSTSNIQLDPVSVFTQPETRDTGTAQAVLSIPSVGTVGLAVQTNAVTSGTVGLAVQVNSGTVGRANSVANPTGGTVDLVGSVTSLTFSGSAVDCNLKKIDEQADVDGLSIGSFYMKQKAQLVGTIHRAGNNATILNEAGGTSMVVTTTTGSRVVA